MEANQRLTTRLNELQQMGPEDMNWYHFVRDHKKYLKRKSNIRVYTPEQLVKYRFRPGEFFADQCRGPMYMTWIFLLVNDIRDPSDFNENNTKITMVMPDAIQELYQLYSTSQSRLDDSEV